MRVEWPTLLLIFACYAAWIAALFLLPQFSTVAGNRAVHAVHRAALVAAA
jgi:type II secretory pathway component PulF